MQNGKYNGGRMQDIRNFNGGIWDENTLVVPISTGIEVWDSFKIDGGMWIENGVLDSPENELVSGRASLHQLLKA